MVAAYYQSNARPGSISDFHQYLAIPSTMSKEQIDQEVRVTGADASVSDTRVFDTTCWIIATGQSVILMKRIRKISSKTKLCFRWVVRKQCLISAFVMRYTTTSPGKAWNLLSEKIQRGRWIDIIAVNLATWLSRAEYNMGVNGDIHRCLSFMITTNKQLKSNYEIDTEGFVVFGHQSLF